MLHSIKFESNVNNQKKYQDEYHTSLTNSIYVIVSLSLAASIKKYGGQSLVSFETITFQSN
jgi:hypothetical protein